MLIVAGAHGFSTLLLCCILICFESAEFWFGDSFSSVQFSSVQSLSRVWLYNLQNNICVTGIFAFWSFKRIKTVFWIIKYCYIFRVLCQQMLCPLVNIQMSKIINKLFAWLCSQWVLLPYLHIYVSFMNII